MSRRALFLFNPASNGGRAARYEDELREKIPHYFVDAELILTKACETFWNEARDKLSGYNLIVACGGDGTVHRAGNLAANRRLPLGIVPLGSGNDFATMLQVPKKPVRALQLLATKPVSRVDLIKLEGDLECWCLNTCGIGLDGLTNLYRDTYKSIFGRFAYLPAVLKAIAVAKPFKMDLNFEGEEILHQELLMVTACNGFREGGKFLVAHQASCKDGRMNVLRIHPLHPIARLPVLPQFLLRTPSYLKSIDLNLCAKLSVSCSDSLPVHVDGEYSGTTINNLEMTIKKGRLEIIF
ncbi:MAG: diacylglycerol kinase family protein [Balneolaceae bacterium]